MKNKLSFAEMQNLKENYLNRYGESEGVDFDSVFKKLWIIGLLFGVIMISLVFFVICHFVVKYW